MSELAFFATAGRGLEGLLAEELRQLGLAEVREQRGGVAFKAELAGGYRACLWSRLANRILLPLTHFSADDADGLYAGARTLDWLDHLGPEHSLAIEFTGVRPVITHSQYAAQRIKDAVVDQLRERTGERPSVDLQHPDIYLHGHMHEREVTLALDLSGPSLHRRGYREEQINAPLKENLAAAILVRGQWPAIAQLGGGFIDPMCGSGTLAIEAAWMAGGIAPGLLRSRFGFEQWRGHQADAWTRLYAEAQAQRQQALAQGLPPIFAYDSDPGAVRITTRSVARAGLDGHIHIAQADIASLALPAEMPPGLLATNPPYGERIGSQATLLALYAQLGTRLREQFPGWQAIILNGAGHQLGLAPKRRWQMSNGPLECQLEYFQIANRPIPTTTVIKAPDLLNRIQKNQRHLSRWLKREGIECYRVYDADIPEYALAIDVYHSTQGAYLHVQEYQAPASIDPAQAASRLRDALSTLPHALAVEPQRILLKVRQRQRGNAQYQRQGERGEWLTVREGACRFYVNLTDYLDTGLFLDHRPVRLWLAAHAQGKRLLNLFCYTGTATVHAACGGARSTTSVDLSPTYLDWLDRNLALNGQDRPAHQRIQADVMDWLADCKQRYELIFLDPPSFSNSKRMDHTLDIQRDHVALIREATRCLTPDGVLIFSTNLRRFQLDASLSANLHIEDRSRWSIPKDFERHQRIHQCWFIRKRSETP